ncbi:MAG: extracellular solute-binding protein [bacterium]|nr:extracellular solute-binding protein [bacterium]
MMQTSKHIATHRTSLAVCLVLTGLFIACTAGGSEPPPASSDSSGEPLEITFSYWANYKDEELFRFVCAGFEEKYPHIKVKRLWYVGDYGRKLQLDLITNTAADLILMDDETYPMYAIRGYLEDLAPYAARRTDFAEGVFHEEIEKLGMADAALDPDSELLPTATQSFNYRGLQGAMPWDGNVVVMYYNKEIFDEAGEPYPEEGWTWDDFRGMAKRMTKDIDGDGRIDQFGTNFFFSFLDFEPIIWSFGGQILNDDKTRSAIQEPRGVEAANFLHTIKYEDRSVAWTGEIEELNTEVLLLTGRVALVAAMTYMVPTLNRVDDAMEWDLAPMPIGPYGDRHTRVTWDGISINARTTQDKKEAAWLFAKHLLSDEVQSFIGTTQRGLPVRRRFAEEDYVDPDTPAKEEVALAATDYGHLTPITPRYLDLRDAMASEFDRLNFFEVDDITVEGAFARLGPKINKVLDKEVEDWARLQQSEDVKEGQALASGMKAFGVAILLIIGFAGALLLIPRVRRGFAMHLEEARHMLGSKMARQEAFEGLAFAAPWLIGLCLLTAFPIVFSIVLSFCEWDPYQPISNMEFVGLENFQRAFSADEVTGGWGDVGIALYNTFYYAIFLVPLGLCLSLGLALLLNQKVRGITIFRTTFYLPSIISGVATVVLWMYIFNPVFGPLNATIRFINNTLDYTYILSFINLPEPMWLGDPAWSKNAVIIMGLWGAGGAGMLIFLAGLQGVPDQLYEVAELDGAGRFRKFWNVTLPMLTPTIYFNLIMGTIGALKVFMQAFIMTRGTGGVGKSLLFYVLYLYKKAFQEFEMGYASALAWILFVIILSLTMLVIKSSAVWVYYEGERKR